MNNTRRAVIVGLLMLFAFTLLGWLVAPPRFSIRTGCATSTKPRR